MFLIPDNLRVYQSKHVNAWVKARKKHIELFCLPSYSPELNLEERVSAYLNEAGDG